MASGEVSSLVEKALNSIEQPWPSDVIDRVCLAIEQRSEWLARYHFLVKKHGRHAVNAQIGRSTLQLTGLRNLGARAAGTSSLIDTYTLLG